jgi:hypothetical protein
MNAVPRPLLASLALAALALAASAAAAQSPIYLSGALSLSARSGRQGRGGAVAVSRDSIISS